MKNSNRFSVFVYPKVQLALIAVPLVLGGVILFIVAKTVNSVFTLIERDVLEAGVPANHELYQLLSFHRETILANLTATATLGGAAVAIFLLIYSHRFLGPMIRLRRFFQEYKKESPGTLKFRKGDYFSEVAEDVNKALKANE